MQKGTTAKMFFAVAVFTFDVFLKTASRLERTEMYKMQSHAKLGLQRKGE